MSLPRFRCYRCGGDHLPTFHAPVWWDDPYAIVSQNDEPLDVPAARVVYAHSVTATPAAPASDCLARLEGALRKRAERAPVVVKLLPAPMRPAPVPPARAPKPKPRPAPPMRVFVPIADDDELAELEARYEQSRLDEDAALVAYHRSIYRPDRRGLKTATALVELEAATARREAYANALARAKGFHR